MAEIVIGAALSHSPLVNVDVPADARAAVDAYRVAARALGDEVRAAKPDVLVILSQDHFRTVFYKNMPAFMIGLGDVTRWGDWRGSKGPLNTDVEFARHVARGLFARDFEPAVSYDMMVDHGTSQVLELMGLLDLPIVPVYINAHAPPLPTPARSFAFGEALRGAIQAFAGAKRVAVIGSGGLSHAPLKITIETEQNPQTRDFLLNGPKGDAGDDEDRIKGIMAKIDLLAKAISPEWDRMILKRLEALDAKALAAELDDKSIEAGGGTGGQEVRCWLAMMGAAQPTKVRTVFYQPVPFLVTGMGAIVATGTQGAA